MNVRTAVLATATAMMSFCAGQLNAQQVNNPVVRSTSCSRHGPVDSVELVQPAYGVVGNGGRQEPPPLCMRC
jgi:hypothetical protein